MIHFNKPKPRKERESRSHRARLRRLQDEDAAEEVRQYRKLDLRGPDTGDGLGKISTETISP